VSEHVNVGAGLQLVDEVLSPRKAVPPRRSPLRPDRLADPRRAQHQPLPRVRPVDVLATGGALELADDAPTPIMPTEKEGLSSPFGGDWRRAIVTNSLVTGGFPGAASTPRVAHFCEASVRAHSAGHPWPAGRPPLAGPRSTTSTEGAEVNDRPAQSPCSRVQPSEPTAEPPTLGLATATDCRRRIATGRRHSARGQPPRGPDSPPNDEESQKKAIFDRRYRVKIRSGLTPRTEISACSAG
jgi:hypothetical protein